ncbi:hypothetical protein DSO57_1007302 [Entomophthora muscae]|uniref:Uncharacterized protein n=1 Tax=Entomophthora muscae TaxID=34485 RepID=A0ACC2RM09_9FUNG|nr:hypothetical protein DSO57_1007302 [Entomophthora muscae]
MFSRFIFRQNGFNYSTKAKLSLEVPLTFSSCLTNALKNDVSLWKAVYPNGEVGTTSVSGLPLNLNPSHESLELIDTCLKLCVDFDEHCLSSPNISLEQIWHRSFTTCHLPSVYKIIECLYRNKNKTIILEKTLHSSYLSKITPLYTLPSRRIWSDGEVSVLSIIWNLNIEEFNHTWFPLKNPWNSLDFSEINERFLTEVSTMKSKPNVTSFGLPVKTSSYSPLEHQLFKKVSRYLEGIDALTISPHSSLADARRLIERAKASEVSVNSFPTSHEILKSAASDQKREIRG